MSSPSDLKLIQGTGVGEGADGDIAGVVGMLARALLACTENLQSRSAAPAPRGSNGMGWGCLAKAIYAERTRRSKFFDADLFGEPAWDILLDLLVSDETGEPRSVKALCLSSKVPEATALRHIAKLTESGLIKRTPDKIDRRRAFLSLTPQGKCKMQAYLASMPPIGDHVEKLVRSFLTKAARSDAHQGELAEAG